MAVGREPWRVHPVRDLLDAVIQHYNVGVICRRCKHRRTLCSLGLWYRFAGKEWCDSIQGIRRHLKCSQCGAKNPGTELVTGEADGPKLPIPDDRTLRRALDRRR